MPVYACRCLASAQCAEQAAETAARAHTTEHLRQVEVAALMIQHAIEQSAEHAALLLDLLIGLAKNAAESARVEVALRLRMVRQCGHHDRREDRHELSRILRAESRRLAKA